MNNRLQIFMGGSVVASIWVDKADEAYKLEYSDEWKKDGFSISPHIKLDTPVNSGILKRFLENLIPEGKGLEDILQFTHISKNNTFAIIKAIGYDTSGALIFGTPLELIWLHLLGHKNGRISK